MNKPWYSSNTIQFFALVLAGGGIDLIVGFIQGDVSWRSALTMVIGMAGIALRLKTSQPIQ